jgi:hypothetical protein
LRWRRATQICDWVGVSICSGWANCSPAHTTSKKYATCTTASLATAPSCMSRVPVWSQPGPRRREGFPKKARSRGVL